MRKRYVSIKMEDKKRGPGIEQRIEWGSNWLEFEKKIKLQYGKPAFLGLNTANLFLYLPEQLLVIMLSKNVFKMIIKIKGLTNEQI